MKRLSVRTAVLVVAAGLAAPASAGGINLNGPHYNLDIIGVENPKTAPLTGSERHTIFVGLGKQSKVTSNIYLAPGPFGVCDGNAFDAARSRERAAARWPLHALGSRRRSEECPWRVRVRRVLLTGCCSLDGERSPPAESSWI